MSAATDRLLGALDALPPVSLDEIVAEAAMMTRVDRKYAVPVDVAETVLGMLPAGTRALEIDGSRAARYASTYFDTVELDCYHRAAQPRRRRLKVRVRTYLDSGTAYLELKTRGARGTTVKERMPHPAEMPDRLMPAERREIALALASVGADEQAALHPVLETRYRRSTLLLPGGEGRATIDTELEWLLLVGAIDPADRPVLRRPALVVIETKSGARPSAVDRLLWQHGQRPVRLSKYGTGLAAFAPALPHSRWHRTLRRDLALATAA